MNLLRIALPVLLVCLIVMVGLSWRQQARARQLVERRLRQHVVPIDRGEADDVPEASVPANWVGRQLFRAQMGWNALILLGAVALLILLTLRMLWLSSFETAMLAPLLAGLVAMVVRTRISRRMNQLHNALPNFLDRLRQQILIGASVPQAIQRAVAVSPPVVQWVFEPVERRVLAGGELVETLEWATRRHGGEGLASFTAAISASIRYGGRLSEAIATLAVMERMRVQVHQEMHGATAEVRASSLILAALPLVVSVMMFLTSPTHRQYFFDPEQGRSLLYAAGGLYLFGLFLLRQIAQPKF